MGKRAGQRVEVDLAALCATSACLSQVGKKPTWDGQAKWQDIKTIWMKWCTRCQEAARLKQKAMYSWARTLTLCAALCLVGALLEVQFDESISIDHVVAAFCQSPSAEAISRTVNSYPHHRKPMQSATSLK